MERESGLNSEYRQHGQVGTYSQAGGVRGREGGAVDGNIRGDGFRWLS